MTRIRLLTCKLGEGFKEDRERREMGVAKQKFSAQMRYAAGCERRSEEGTSRPVIKREGVRDTEHLESQPIKKQTD